MSASEWVRTVLLAAWLVCGCLAAEEVNGQRADWPSWRGDGSGASPIALAPALAPVWMREIGGRIRPSIAAGGKVFVASVDAHQVHALNAATGAPVWSRIAGGRVDSPPTYYRGRVFFGCRDGWVYCLRASDGVRCWRFLAARRDERIGAFDQIESVWPVHGSVLVQDGVVYCAAGRSSFLDGGIRLYALAPQDGRVLHETRLADAEQSQSAAFNMPTGALSDVFVGDGRCVYMGRHSFDAAFQSRMARAHGNAAADKKGVADVDLHLMSTSGFLDDT